ncbi:MAG TPA: glycoside hydrolase family 57 protein, partial [Candidatus Saccharibacteria bacterium]|nr:glycoside hydrolase family 57 protein [Candidatus Saccharibacteria bacterium]
MNRQGIALYLHVHQPYRIREYSVFDITSDRDYFMDSATSTSRSNRLIFEKVADKSYRPMTKMLLKLLKEHPEFRVSFSITGVFIEQAKAWAPDVLELFQQIVATGQADIVAETYHHSLAFFYSRKEFERQVELHAKTIKKIFGVTPTVFRNTELAYNDKLGKWAESKGYKAIIAEGWDPVLGQRSPNHVYRPVGAESIALLLKNYRLSDDVAFRFSNKSWQAWPLKADTYTSWLESSHDENTDSLVNLFMDFETFGEHQWGDTGIFEFFEDFVSRWLSKKHRSFFTLSEAVDAYSAVDTVSMPATVTWADTERDLSAWIGHDMQKEALRYI